MRVEREEIQKYRVLRYTIMRELCGQYTFTKEHILCAGAEGKKSLLCGAADGLTPPPVPAHDNI